MARLGDLLQIPVTLAQDADEERPALIDLLQTHIEGLVVVRLLIGHAPTQIDVNEAAILLRQPQFSAVA